MLDFFSQLAELRMKRKWTNVCLTLAILQFGNTLTFLMVYLKKAKMSFKVLQAFNILVPDMNGLAKRAMK